MLHHDITDITLVSAIYYCIAFAMVTSFILGYMYLIYWVLTLNITLANTSDLVVLYNSYIGKK